MEMFLAPLPMVNTFCNLLVLREYVLALMPSTTTKKCLISKLLKQCYRYHRLRKAFSKFYHIHLDLIVKYNMCLKTLLQQGISHVLHMLI